MKSKTCIYFTFLLELWLLELELDSYFLVNWDFVKRRELDLSLNPPMEAKCPLVAGANYETTERKVATFGHQK